MRAIRRAFGARGMQTPVLSGNIRMVLPQNLWVAWPSVLAPVKRAGGIKSALQGSGVRALWIYTSGPLDRRCGRSGGF